MTSTARPLDLDDSVPDPGAPAPEPPHRDPISWRQIIGIPLNVLFFLLIMALSYGDGFLAHPVRLGVVVLHVLMIPIMTFWTSGRSRGVKHAADWRPFFPLLVFHTMFTCWAMPYMDARNLWVLPGADGLRWFGLAALAAGVLLRLGPMVELGRRFVSVVALRDGHTVHTRGFYAAIRHPSYLGILLMDVGFAGVFRSAVAVALLPLVFWMFKRRMDVEEAFMVDQLGDEYRDYMKRTARLIPGVY